MPFKSEKQRKWMWANDPEMAKKWEKEEKMKKETKVRQLIKKMVRETMDEDFAGSYPAHVRKQFDGKRRKQSEVLGYKLTGKNDIKTEIDDATVHENPKPIKETAKRDYKDEYKKFQSSTKSKKYRAELNKYNRDKGTYGNGDGKDASHKGGKIVGFEKESVNRGRREKSRLKKEHVVKFTKDEMAKIHKDGKIEKADDDGKMHTYVFTEGKITETNKSLPPFEIAKRMMKSKYWNKAGKGFSEKVIKKFRGRGVTPKSLDKWLPDYIEGKEISKLFEGKLTEGREPLWTKETAKDAVNQVKKGLKNAVPYTDGIGTGFAGESIIGKISLDDKKTWSHNILENSRWCLIHIHPDGTLDTVRISGYGDAKTRKAVPILRKSKNKTLKQAIDRLGKYLTMVRIKYPDSRGK